MVFFPRGRHRNNYKQVDIKDPKNSDEVLPALSRVTTNSTRF